LDGHDNGQQTIMQKQLGRMKMQTAHCAGDYVRPHDDGWIEAKANRSLHCVHPLFCIMPALEWDGMKPSSIWGLGKMNEANKGERGMDNGQPKPNAG
jgi:hypothetical protein